MKALKIITLLVLSVGLYANTMKNSFVWDDNLLIAENMQIRKLSNIPSMLVYQEKYRPLREILFALEYAFWGLNPAGYHLVNLVLHVLNVILIYTFILILSGSLPNEKRVTVIAFWAAVFFAAHPIHTESISWIKNCSELLAMLFILLSIINFAQYAGKRYVTGIYTDRVRYFLSILCFILALLSKEMALTLPLLLMLYTAYFVPPKAFKKAYTDVVPFFLIIIFYYIGKGLFPQQLAAESAIADPKVGLADFRPIITFLIVVKTVGSYLFLLLFPFKFNAERSICIPKSIFETPVILSFLIIFIFLFGAIKTYSKHKLISFSLLWIFISIIPASNIVPLTSRLIAEQRLYIPSLGFCVILGVLTSILLCADSRYVFKRNTAVISVVLMLFSYSYAVVKRNTVWKDPFTFWSTTFQDSSNNLRAYYNLGDIYIKNGDYKRAIVLLNDLIKIRPKEADVYNNLGFALYNIGEIEKAVANLKKALDLNPVYIEAHNNLGLAYAKLGRTKEAIRSFKKVISLDPDYIKAYNNLGIIYNKHGKSRAALKLFKKTVEIDPSYYIGFYNLGVAYKDSGMIDEAIESFNKTIELKPDYKEAREALAEIYIK